MLAGVLASGQTDVADAMLGMFWQTIGPLLQFVVPLVVVGAVLAFPMPGRGPVSRRRDPWRTFKFGARATVMERAGGRCESSLFLAWGRCGDPAVEADHVFPYSKGGPTVVSNGQALCRSHNRRKGSMTPPWWDVLALEKRRRAYFPEGSDVRVRAVMSEADRAAREASATRRRGQLRGGGL